MLWLHEVGRAAWFACRRAAQEFERDIAGFV